MIRRGWTAIELMVSLFVTSILLIAMYGLYQMQANVQTEAFDVTASARDARGPLDTLSDHLRMASMCDSGQGCTGVSNSALDSGSASDLTYYSSASGAKVRYHVSGTTLVRTVGTSNTNALVNVDSLTFTYYVCALNVDGTAPAYNSATLTPTANPNAPTSAELPSLGAVRITASTSTEGRTLQYSTLVRLRNSPKRTKLGKGY